MNPFDLTYTLDHMIVLVDTREQETAKARRRYRDFGCQWRREKLDFGDYSAEFELPNGDKYSISNAIAVERKMSLDELCRCFSWERDRFTREFQRAKDAAARIYLLIEGASWEAVYAGKYRSKMAPSAVIASMLAFLFRYDCLLMFCEPGTTGKLIHDILYREAKERLEAMPYEGDKEYI